MEWVVVDVEGEEIGKIEPKTLGYCKGGVWRSPENGQEEKLGLSWVETNILGARSGGVWRCLEYGQEKEMERGLPWADGEPKEGQAK